jgi:hypothetical protein
MSQKPEDAGTNGPGGAAATRPDSDRRRFLVAGLAVAPLIATLSARPAFAQGNPCSGYGASRGVQPEGCFVPIDPGGSSVRGSGS